MTTVVHVVVGPAGHGVVRHATVVARACGHRLVRRDDPGAVVAADLTGADVVHLPFTDRLFGDTAEDAARAFARVTGVIDACGAARSVTLHDLADPPGRPDVDGRSARRRATYRTVVTGARGVVVSSRHELVSADALGDAAWSRRVIPLPVDRVVERPTPDDVVAGTIGILGFLYPGKGIEDVLREVPDGAAVRAIGGPADGHADEPARLAAVATAAGTAWRVTGHVPDELLAAALAQVAVPVAPHRRVSASGSIATWIGHGRRPLVPDGPYAREIDAARPGTVRRYDADRPGALRREIDAALADPGRTMIAPDVVAGPSVSEVARLYRDHLDACATPSPIPAGARWTVPGNRWDLLAALPNPDPPEVSVVIPYYDAPDHLDLVLAALARQDHPSARLEVVVADDGSPRPPRLDAAGSLRVRTVRQRDEGFRAAAARNLGARAAEGEVVAFLDGDTVPEPGYLTALCRLPARSADALVVGRRRHAGESSIRDWLDGTVAGPDPIDEPAWLTDGYTRSRDLLDADERSYRYVISAVLAMHRDLLADTAGFCEQFRAYGGEDWELAARAWHAGALVAHAAEAVAWHIGPDWAGRGADPAMKVVEERMLERLLPDPATRSGGHHRYPATVVVVESADHRVVADAVAAVGGRDAAVWWPVAGPRDDVPPGVRRGRPPADARARARAVVHLTGAGPPGPLLDPARTHGVVTGPGGWAVASRAAGRAARVARATGGRAAPLSDRLFGRRDLA